MDADRLAQIEETVLALEREGICPRAMRELLNEVKSLRRQAQELLPEAWYESGEVPPLPAVHG